MQHLTAHELHDRLSKREISATDLAKAVFGQIDKVEGQVKAYLLLLREQALRQAAKTDEKISRKEKLGTLEGIPIGTEVHINFILPGKDSALVSIEGQVRHTGPLEKDLFRSGVQYLKVKEKDRLAIRKFIAHQKK